MHRLDGIVKIREKIKFNDIKVLGGGGWGPWGRVEKLVENIEEGKEQKKIIYH